MKKLFLYVFAIVFILGCKQTAQDQIFPIKAEVFLRKIASNDSLFISVQIFYADSIAYGNSDTTHYHIKINNDQSLIETKNPNGDLIYQLKTKLSGEDIRINIKQDAKDFISIATQFHETQITGFANSISKKSDVFVDWSGKNLASNEQIFCMITSGKMSAASSQKSGTGNKIILSQSQINELPIGEGMVHLIRTTNDSIQQNNNYAKIRMEYHAKPIRILLQ